MGRKRLPDDLRKEHISIRLPKYLIDFIKKHFNFNNYIEDAVREKVEEDMKKDLK